MSLTDFVNRCEIADLLDRVIPRYDRSLHLGPTVARGVPQRVGTAFDYAVRIELQRRCPDALARPWVAETAVEGLRRFGPAMLRGPTHGTASPVAHYVEVLEAAKAFACRYRRKRKLKPADLETLAHHSVRLARIEPLMRAGRLDSDVREAPDDDVQDVVALLRDTPFEEFAAEQPLRLNPSFGRYSELVGGADADLMVGHRLIELKVTIKDAVERPMVRQLIGYLLLARAARRDDGSFAEIQSIGIYFARQRYMWRHETAEIIDRHESPSVERRFLEHAAALQRAPGVPAVAPQ